MIIELNSKTNAYITTQEIETNTVPRVGESVYSEKHGEFTVFEVCYELHNGSLVPRVSCIAQTGSINRRNILEEQGWL